MEYGVFDRWYASLPGPTYPNRLFAYSGTTLHFEMFNSIKVLQMVSFHHMM